MINVVLPKDIREYITRNMTCAGFVAECNEGVLSTNASIDVIGTYIDKAQRKLGYVIDTLEVK